MSIMFFISQQLALFVLRILAAYDMGMQATEKALINSTEGGKIESEVKTDESTGLRLRDSSKRNGSKDSQKQVSGVEESTGRDTSREDTEGKVADSEAVKLTDEGRKVKVSELGILNGSKTQTVTVVDKSQETSEMKKARKEAEKRGLKVRFFLGDNLVIEENGELISVRGYIKGEYVFVRADHPLYTSYQLMRHEIGHDMIAKGEVDINKVRAKLEETVGMENIDAVADMYASAYERSGLDADAIWEECICDSLGDMNVFSDFADIDQRVVATLLGDIKQATEDTKTAPNKTRGAPKQKNTAKSGEGKYSIEITEDGIRYVKLDGNIFLKPDGTEMSPVEAYNALVGTQITLEDGDVITFVKNLPKRSVYRELFHKLPGYEPGIDVKAVSEAINKNIVDVVKGSTAQTRNEPQKHRHIGIKDFDQREVYILDNNQTYRFELCIANLTDGTKIAYVKRYIEKANAEIDKKIKKEETAKQSRLNQPSIISISQKSDLSTQNSKIVKKTSRELDTDYLSAVERGDMETALIETDKMSPEQIEELDQFLQDNNGEIT